MAKLYHNGEYLESGGGSVASAMTMYHVALHSIPTVDNPVIIPDISIEGTGTIHEEFMPFKLFVTNQSVDVLRISNPDGEFPFYMKFKGSESPVAPVLEASGPAFRNPGMLNIDNLKKFSISPRSMAQIDMRPGDTAEFTCVLSAYNDTGYINRRLTLIDNSIFVPNYLAGVTSMSSTSETLVLYSSNPVVNRPIPFIVSTCDYMYSGGDFKEAPGCALTVGSIMFSDDISINQMPIFGNLQITSIQRQTYDGIPIEVRDWTKPMKLLFRFSGANTYVRLHLFT